MDWKEFFKITNQKLKITGILVVFSYFYTNFSQLLTGIIIPSISITIHDMVMILLKQPGYPYFLLIGFLALIISSYIFACIIVSIFPRKGKK